MPQYANLIDIYCLQANKLVINSINITLQVLNTGANPPRPGDADDETPISKPIPPLHILCGHVKHVGDPVGKIRKVAYGLSAAVVGVLSVQRRPSCKVV
jgi:hypothetical protein